MRRAWTVRAAVGTLIAAGACVSTPGATPSSTEIGEVSPQSAPQNESRSLNAQERDSVVAQVLADKEGPGAWVYADATSVSGARQVRADFHLDDDAYVVVGHIDADGVMRIVFPRSPNDNGFVRGGQSYLTDEFFAGFNDEYRYKAQERTLVHGLTPQTDSYDGGLGYVFVVASWRPMRFDAFQTDGVWNRYELSDDDYLRDPRPAIQEFASLLAGGNQEAFTVKYASSFSTIASSGGYLGDGFDSGYCSGFDELGFRAVPWGLRFTQASYLMNGSAFDVGYGGGCSSGGGYDYSNYIYGLGVYQQIPAAVVARRNYAFTGNRPVPRPQPFDKLHLPATGQDASPGSAGHQRLVPGYRERGLITTGGADASGSARRSPHPQLRAPGTSSARSGIEQTLNHREENGAGTAARTQHRAESRQTAPRESSPRVAAPRSAPQAPVARSAPAASAATAKPPV